MCAPLFQRVEDVLKKCYDDSKLSASEIHSVEIVGGSTRIPAIKSIIEKVFGKTPSTTLNQDEAVSRGCALQCAILSPAFKVRDFSITDAQPYPIKLVWDESLGENGYLEVFPQYHPIPFSRMVTFFRKDPITLKAIYSGQVPYPTNDIGQFVINVKTDEQEPPKVKVKARINMNGVFSVCGATVYEKLANAENSEEPMEGESVPASQDSTTAGSQESTENSEPMDNSENPEANATSGEANPEEAEKKKKKVQLKSKELSVDSLTFGLSRAELDEKIMSETHMISRDRNEKDRLDNRNALEEYVYDLREKLDSDLNSFVEDSERQSLSQILSHLENWLYEDGSDEKKEVYMQKLQELRSKGEPIKERRIESEERPRAMQEVEIGLQLARKIVDLYYAKDTKYDHIPEADMAKVKQTIQESEAWLANCRQQFNQNFKPHMPVPIKSKDIREQRKLLESKITPIINKPKPKVEPPKEDSNKEQDAKGKQNASEPPNANNGDGTGGPVPQEPMEVD
jgi:heat shock protein